MKKKEAAQTDTRTLAESEKRASGAAKKSQGILDMVSLPQGRAQAIDGMMTGKLCAYSPDGGPVVDYPENKTKRPIPARSIIALSERDIGRDVVLMFERGDAARPVVMGIIQNPENRQDVKVKTLTEFTGECVTKIDGERLVFDARDEVTLRCGKSSITMTKDGKVVIKGVKITSRASQENKIKGGSVAIN